MNIVYAYLRDQFKQSGNGLIQLMLIHILSFLFIFLFNTGCYISGYENHILWLYAQLTFPSLWPLLLERPWTIITYSFVHKGLLNLFWDMLILYMYGQRMRTATPSKHIAWLYFLGQTVGAVAFFLLYQFSPPFSGISADLIGPSAPIYAIMVAVCVLMPNLKLYLFFFSLPLRYVTIFLLLIAFMHLPSQHAGYYLAQLSGALAGYFYAKICKNNLDINGPFFRISNVNRTKMSVTITKKQGR